jgi:hypothetical protein
MRGFYLHGLPVDKNNLTEESKASYEEFSKHSDDLRSNLTQFESGTMKVSYGCIDLIVFDLLKQGAADMTTIMLGFVIILIWVAYSLRNCFWYGMFFFNLIFAFIVGTTFYHLVYEFHFYQSNFILALYGLIVKQVLDIRMFRYYYD